MSVIGRIEQIIKGDIKGFPFFMIWLESQPYCFAGWGRCFASEGDITEIEFKKTPIEALALVTRFRTL